MSAGALQFLFQLRFLYVHVGTDPGTDDAAAQGGVTGMELAICQEFVTLMGGTLEVESQPGRGSKFELGITLPKKPFTNRSKK